MKRKSYCRLRGIERLERRAMLAGDCTVLIDHGNLKIECDDDANDLLVEQVSPGSDQFQITGVGTTTINQSSIPLLVSGVNRNVDVTLGQGFLDHLVLMNADLPRNLSVTSGDDGAVINVMQIHVARDFRYTGGSGQDNLSVANSLIQGQLAADFGDGISNAFFSNSTVDDDLRLISHGGMSNSVSIVDSHVGKKTDVRNQSVAGDTIIVANSSLEGDVRLQNASLMTSVVLLTGTDVEGDVLIDDGLADAAIAGVQLAVSGSLRVEDEGGALSMNLIDFSVAHDLELSAGTSTGHSFGMINGSIGKDLEIESHAEFASYFIDTVGIGGRMTVEMASQFGAFSHISLVDTTIGKDLRVQTGSGADYVSLTRVSVGKKTRIETGAGDDFVSAVDSIFAGDFNADGDDGSDTLEDLGNQFLKKRKTSDFETELP